MTNIFSGRDRDKNLTEFTNQEFDLLVIGGGITGAGIVLDATARGIKTALIEMQDFAAGTSSRSTKLVHGGLRYLKQFELKLVAEVGKERAIVYENGPHITKAEPMLLPLIKGGSIGSVGAFIGMYVYDLLAGVRKDEHRKMLNKAETLKKEPLLINDSLYGGVHYFEYRTDDARLTIEVLKEAADRGAKISNYIKAISFITKDKKIVGVNAEDQISGKTYQIFAKQIVNATGPWVDILDAMDDPSSESKLHLTKGVHVVVDHKKLPIKQSIYFDTDDRRMIFAIPRDGKTYIGTTDTNYTGPIENPGITPEDKVYLIKAVNKIFPGVNLKIQDIESGWAGLRPLIRQRGKSPSAISRKDEIFQSASGLITIAGGKLTGYRKMAERVTDLVVTRFKNEGKKFPGCTTDKIKISGGKFDGAKNFNEYIKEKTKSGIHEGLTEESAKALAEKYGSNVEKIFEIIRTSGEEAKKNNLPVTLFAQLKYAIDEEMALSPSDFFIRRTSALYFNIDWVRQWKDAVISFMSKYLHWDEAQKNKYKEELEKQFKGVSS
jgi:glycerol-3-phosphate dehydrogenase